MPVSIAGRTCRLRQWLGSDAEALVPLANDPYIARYLSHVFPQPYTRADADRWIREHAAETAGQFAIEVNGEFAGGIGFIIGQGERVGTASLGYWLGRRLLGQRRDERGGAGRHAVGVRDAARAARVGQRDGAERRLVARVGKSRLRARRQDEPRDLRPPRDDPRRVDLPACVHASRN